MISGNIFAPPEGNNPDAEPLYKLETDVACKLLFARAARQAALPFERRPMVNGAQFANNLRRMFGLTNNQSEPDNRKPPTIGPTKTTLAGSALHAGRRHALKSELEKTR